VKKKLDAVIWTDFSSNFEDVRKMMLNEDNAIAYLKSLTGESLIRAEEYIRRAPSQIKTRIRTRIEEELGWTYNWNLGNR